MMYRHVQGTDGQFLGHPCAHGVSHNFTGTLVLNASKIEPTFRRGDVGNVHVPDDIGFLREKVLLQ